MHTPTIATASPPTSRMRRTSSTPLVCAQCDCNGPKPTLNARRCSTTPSAHAVASLRSSAAASAARAAPLPLPPSRARRVISRSRSSFALRARSCSAARASRRARRCFAASISARRRSVSRASASTSAATSCAARGTGAGVDARCPGADATADSRTASRSAASSAQPLDSAGFSSRLDVGGATAGAALLLHTPVGGRVDLCRLMRCCCGESAGRSDLVMGTADATSPLRRCRLSLISASSREATCARHMLHAVRRMLFVVCRLSNEGADLCCRSARQQR
jgi:hypothetical protein